MKLRALSPLRAILRDIPCAPDGVFAPGSLGEGVVHGSALADGGVGLEKLADAPGGSLLGRAAAGDGPVAALSGAEAAGILGISLEYPDLAALQAADHAGLAPGTLARVRERVAGGGGGAVWRLVESDPGHPMAVASTGGIWEIAERAVSPEMAGAVGDGAADDGFALQDAADWAAATGGAVRGTPGAVYRTTEPVLLLTDGVAFEGSGATLVFDGAAGAAAVEVGEGPRVTGVAVRGWRFAPSLLSHRLVRFRRASSLEVSGCSVEGGLLVEGVLPSDSAGASGAAWDASRPDVAAVAEEDLSRDVRVSGNRCDGLGRALDGGADAAAIRLGWVAGFAVSENEIRGYGEAATPGSAVDGIVWHGGDPDPARDGGASAPRWAREGSVEGNTVREVRHGLRGERSEAVSVRFNRVASCAGGGLGAAGDRGSVVACNWATECAGGGLLAEHGQDGTVYSDNTISVLDSGRGDVVAVWRGGDSGSSARFLGNALAMKDGTAGRFVVEGPGRAEIAGNRLSEVVIASDAPGVGPREVVGNRLSFAALDGAAVAVRVSGRAVVLENAVEAAGADAVGLRIVHDAAASEAVVESLAAEGPAVAVVSESLAVGDHVTRVSGVRGMVVDVTDTAALGAAPARVIRREAEGARPVAGLWSEGAAGVWEVASPGAATLGAWDAGTAYARWSHVTGSDGAAYVAMADVAGDDPVLGGVWRRVADAPARFRSTAAGEAVSPRDFGAVGDGAADDTDAFEALAAHVAAEADAGRWPTGYGEVPRVIDGGGMAYRIARDVTLAGNVHLRDMRLRMDMATLTLGSQTAPDGPRVHLSNVDARFVGGADHPGAVIAIPRCVNSVVDETCLIDGGRGSARARYGLYAGEVVAYGSAFLGTFRGGECALRVGRERDNTSNRIAPSLCDRSRVVNALICNPKGVAIKGDFEHSEGCPVLAITSETNGSADVAEAVELAAGYAYNVGLGAGSSDGRAAVLIGHDVPGTEGWDGPGVVTSGAGARMVSVHDMYMVSDHVETFLRIRALYGVTLERITWGGTPTGANPQTLAELSGQCAETRVAQTRHQNTGAARPALASSAANRVLVEEAGAAFQPAVFGADAGGSVTYSTREGRWSVRGGVASVSGHAAWSAASGGAGRLRIALPAGLTPAAPFRAAATLVSGGFAAPVQGLVFPGDAHVTLTWQNSDARLNWADMPASGQLHFGLEFPVDRTV